MHGLIQVLKLVAARNQIEAADAGAIDVDMRGGVAEYQRVVFVQLIIQARAHTSEALGRSIDAEERLNAEGLLIHGYSIDDGPVVDGVPLRIQREGCALADRPTGLPFQFVEQQRRLLGGVGIARIPKVVGIVVMDVAAIMIGARLGEDFNSSETEFVVFR